MTDKALIWGLYLSLVQSTPQGFKELADADFGDKLAIMALYPGPCSLP